MPTKAQNSAPWRRARLADTEEPCWDRRRALGARRLKLGDLFLVMFHLGSTGLIM